MNNQEIQFKRTDYGYQTVRSRYHCDINKQRNGSWVVWRNRRGYTCNTLKGAKAIAGSLIADAQR
tara:strand:- start:1145 stop:1339 length:195 start_codon:yes stop_codon:yes gene_type:complete